MQADKKEKERFYLNLFKEALADFPKGTIEEGETPDFCVIDGSKRVGIELTELFRPVTVNKAPLQQRESFLQRLARNASDIHEKRGFPRGFLSIVREISILFCFGEQWPFTLSSTLLLLWFW